jgi:F-type H+-transporting ATPase subunit epsilon
MDTFELEIATPARLALRVAAREAQVPATTGYLGVLPGHAPLLAELGTGELTVTREDRSTTRMVVSGGFVEIRPERVILLADVAESVEQIDAARARRQLEEAQRLSRSTDAGVDYAAAVQAVRLAEARISLAERGRGDKVHS